MITNREIVGLWFLCTCVYVHVWYHGGFVKITVHDDTWFCRSFKM